MIMPIHIVSVADMEILLIVVGPNIVTENQYDV